MVVVLVSVRRPPHGVLGGVIHDDELIFRGTAGVDAGHYVHGAQLADLTLFVALKAGFGLFLKEHFVRRIVDDFGRPSDTILRKINVSHLRCNSFF